VLLSPPGNRKSSRSTGEEKLRWQYYRSIPQKHWREMSGPQTKILQGASWFLWLAFRGREDRSAELARAFYDFLAANARKLSAPDDELMQGGPSPALERYREERATMARLDRQEREQSRCPETASGTASDGSLPGYVGRENNWNASLALVPGRYWTKP